MVLFLWNFDEKCAIIIWLHFLGRMGDEMIKEYIREQLQSFRDVEFGKFQCRLIPNIPPESIIGVRTPVLRRMAKELAARPDIDLFLADIPHKYFEENMLHMFVICEGRDYQRCVEQIEAFLPYVDNWATCDLPSAKIMKKHTEELYPILKRWITSDAAYTIRFGINCLMRFYLEEHFEIEHLDLVSGVENPDYYVKMVVAWYFATALAKQYDVTIPYLEGHVLEEWIHKKTIQKAIESFRVTPEHKEYLRTLR